MPLRENISEGDVDDEDAGEESSQTLPLTSQESEEPPSECTHWG